MIGRYSIATIAVVIFVFFLATAIAGIVWFTFPSWLTRRYGVNKNKESLDIEDGYRKALSQVLGLPLAIFGVAGAFITVTEGIAAYHHAVLADFQDRYRRGFDMLASSEAATRIGGLYVLEGLIEQNVELQAGDDAKTLGTQQNTILQSISAFAVDHSSVRRPGSDDPVIAQDSLVALRIVGKSNTDKADSPVNLRGGYFFGSLIPYSNLNHVNLYGANFGGADLYRGHLFETNLRDVNFDGSNLTDVDFSHAGFMNTTFCPSKNFATADQMRDSPVSAQMNNTKFYDAWALRVYFKGAMLERAIFNNSQFTDASFVHADLADAQFRSVRYDGVDFSNAQLARIDFRWDIHPTTLLNAHFDDADVSSGQFDQTEMAKGSFRNADLRGARFVGASLTKMDFAGANLSDATFEGAKIQDSNFVGAILHNTNFQKTVYEKQRPPGVLECDAANQKASAACANFTVPTPEPLQQHCATSPLVRQQNSLK
jgi:uncharacterized protein YjbI with pentapeptide repeats